MQISLLATQPLEATLADLLRSAGHDVRLASRTVAATTCRDAVGDAEVVVVAAAGQPGDETAVHPERLLERVTAGISGSESTMLAVAGDDRAAKAAIQRLLGETARDEAAVVDLGGVDELCPSTATVVEARSRSRHAKHHGRSATAVRPAPAGRPVAWYDHYWLLELIVQAALIVAAALLYFTVRGLTEGSVTDAVRHGHDVLRLEGALGLDIEAAVQRHVLGNHALTTLANWVYIWGHWPVIAITLVWLHRTHRDNFLLLRNAMFVSGAIGLVIFALYPVAPPRHLPDGFVDTVTELSRSYRVLQPPQLINEYAAVPSLHVGWNLLVGILLYRTAPRRVVRVAGIVTPVLMAAAVVATANHYVIDGLIGSAIALTGLYAAHQISRRSRALRRTTRPASTVDAA